MIYFMVVVVVVGVVENVDKSEKVLCHKGKMRLSFR